MVAVERQIQTLREQFLPTIFRVRTSRISITFLESRIVHIHLSILRIHAGRGRVEDFSFVLLCLLVQLQLTLEHVEVDGSRVIHHLRVIVSREDVSSTTHIGSVLIDLIKRFYKLLCYVCIEVALIPREPDDTFHQINISKVTKNELVSKSRRIFWTLDVYTTHPVSFALQTTNHVTANKSTSTTNKCSLLSLRHSILQ